MRLLPLAVAFAVSACLQSGPTSISAPASGKRLLFVGNSQVYVNDLPRMVAELARQARVDSVFVASVAFPNFGLEDHWSEGSALRALQRSKWEFVILQQGPSTLPENRANLEAMVRRFDPAIRAAGAVPVLYQVWPTVDRPNDFGPALVSYQTAARSVGGILAPAGEAWRGAIAEADTIKVYSPDGLHGSVRGTYLAASVILARVFDTDPRTLPPTIPGIREDSATVRFLQRMAAAALTRAPARP
jgi:hypothetical protein